MTAAAVPGDPSARFVALEGIDASGKSTLAAELVAELRRAGEPALLVDRATAPAAAGGYPGAHLAALRALIWEYPADAQTSSLGFAHWSHLLAAWFAGVDHTVVTPALAAGSWVVADPWYYKFATRFAVTVGLDEALAAFAGISAPGTVVWLDVAPDVCAGRRTDLRSTEAGEWQGKDRGRDSFVDYQDSVREHYGTLAASLGWHTVTAPDAASLAGRLLDGPGAGAGARARIAPGREVAPCPG